MSCSEIVPNVIALLYFVSSFGSLIFEGIIEAKHIPDNKVISCVRKMEIPLISAFSIALVLSMFLWIKA